MMTSTGSNQHHTNVEEQARILSDQIRGLNHQLTVVKELASQQETQLVDVRAQLRRGEGQDPRTVSPVSTDILQQLNTARERLETVTRDSEVSLERIHALNERIQDLEKLLVYADTASEDLIEENKALISQNAELLRRTYGDDGSLEQIASLRNALDERESLRTRNDMLSRNIDYLRNGWNSCRRGRIDLHKRLRKREIQLQVLQEQGVDVGELPQVADMIDKASVDSLEFGDEEMHEEQDSIQNRFQQSFFQLATIAQDEDGDVQLEIQLEDGRFDIQRGPDEINSFFRQIAATVGAQHNEVRSLYGSETGRSTALVLQPSGLRPRNTQFTVQRISTLEAQHDAIDNEADMEEDRERQLHRTRCELEHALHERDEARSQRDLAIRERDLAILSRNQARTERERAPSPDSEAFKTATNCHNEVPDSRPRLPEDAHAAMNDLDCEIVNDLPTEEEDEAQEDQDAPARELSLERQLVSRRQEYIEDEEHMQSEEPDNEPPRKDGTGDQLATHTLPHEESSPTHMGACIKIGLEYLLTQTQTERDLALRERDEARAQRDAAQAIPAHRNEDCPGGPEQLAEAHANLESVSRQLHEAITRRDQAQRELATRTAERNGARQRVQLLDDELKEAHIREGGLREQLRLQQETEDPLVAALQDELNGLQHIFDGHLATALAEAERRRLLVVAESKHYFQQVEASNRALLEAQGSVQRLEAALQTAQKERDTARAEAQSGHHEGQSDARIRDRDARDVRPEQLERDLRPDLAMALGRATQQTMIAETATPDLDTARNDRDAALVDVTNISYDLEVARREFAAVQANLQKITKERDLALEQLRDCQQESELTKARAASGEVGESSAVSSDTLDRATAERDAALERIQGLEELLQTASARADAAEGGANVSRHIARNLTDQVNDLVQTREYLRSEILRLDGRIVANGEQVQGKDGRQENVPGSGLGGLVDQQGHAQPSTAGYLANQCHGEQATLGPSSSEGPQSSSRAPQAQATRVERPSASAQHQALSVPSPEPAQQRGSASTQTKTRTWSGPRTTRNPHPNYGVFSSLKRKASKPVKQLPVAKKVKT